MASLSQLLSLPDLGLRLVQAGPGDPELSWASTTELLELGEHLEGGEIVLTTGLALGAEDPRWRDFVAGLNRARVAAIGFGVGVNHERIPAPLIAAASTYRVALVEVPPPVPFIAVSKAVAGLLRADELRSAQRALQAHQRLLEGAQGTQSSAEVLASIAQAVGRQLALLAADGTPIASTAGFAASSRAGGDPAQGGARAEVESIDVDAASGIRLVLAGGEPLGPEGRAVVAAGAMVLGLGLRGERGADERERDRWARLTEGLLRGTLGGSAGVGAVRLLQPEVEVPHRVRAVAVQGAAEDLAAWRRAPRSGWDRLVTAGEPGSPGIALAWQLSDGDEAAVERVIAAASAHGLDTVVGRPVGFEEAAQSCRSAQARVSDLSSLAQLYEAPRTPVTVWADRSSPLLETLISEHRGEGLPSAVLGPLAPADPGLSEHRAPSGVDSAQAGELAELRHTLRTLLMHHGQRGPAAAELGVHRNTLRDRVRRIERLTGRSLDHPDDRAELWLALRLAEAGD